MSILRVQISEEWFVVDYSGRKIIFQEKRDLVWHLSREHSLNRSTIEWMMRTLLSDGIVSLDKSKVDHDMDKRVA